jgi:hypothetical protein
MNLSKGNSRRIRKIEKRNHQALQMGKKNANVELQLNTLIRATVQQI